MDKNLWWRKSRRGFPLRKSSCHQNLHQHSSGSTSLRILKTLKSIATCAACSSVLIWATSLRKVSSTVIVLLPLFNLLKWNAIFFLLCVLFCRKIWRQPDPHCPHTSHYGGHSSSKTGNGVYCSYGWNFAIPSKLTSCFPSSFASMFTLHYLGFCNVHLALFLLFIANFWQFQNVQSQAS